MHTFAIFKEEADSNNKSRQLLGELQAETMSDALDLAAQYYEIPQHDLVAVLVSAALVRCPWCGQMHQANQVEACPLKPKKGKE